MPMQRQTAIRARIVDIVSGEFVKKEGMEPSYVVTPGKENISRAKIVGTIVGKFDSDDGNFSSVTIDDATATMRAKLWKEVDLLKNAKEGQLVSLVGKVREYEGEIYMVPEILTQVSPDEETLARLEVLRKMKTRVSPTAASAPRQEARPPAPKAAPEAEEAPSTHPEEEDSGNAQPLQTAGSQADVHPRKKVMDIIEENPDGIKYSDLARQAGIPEDVLENVINELLGEGVCYEPLPGKIKKI